MSSSRFAISWIYGEFIIARMQHGLPVQQWKCSFPVDSLESLCHAMAGASEHIDLRRGGDLAIVYEDDLHTHEFLALPIMDKKDLEKLLSRRVEQNKPFDGKAAWCFHEAKSENEEGILLHLLPQHIVNSTARICQEFHLTPRLLVPVTEIMSALVQRYQSNPSDILIIAALFTERTEIVITMGSGEVLFVRELPYSGYGDGMPRLVTDINRTIRYTKQQFSGMVDTVWLLGENVDKVQAEIDIDIETNLVFDEKSLDPVFWAIEAANLEGQLSANFIPLLARKRINKSLLSRIALWVISIIFLSALVIAASVEYIIARQPIQNTELISQNKAIKQQILLIEKRLEQADQDKKKLQLLQADTQNLPALFISHLGSLIPPDLVLTQADIVHIDGQWKITLSGNSRLSLSKTAPVLSKLEDNLTQSPWNITIVQSWKHNWYEQLKSGVASNTATPIEFKITGWMK